jgi:hypothetical protein
MYCILYKKEYSLNCLREKEIVMTVIASPKTACNESVVNGYRFATAVRMGNFADADQIGQFMFDNGTAMRKFLETTHGIPSEQVDAYLSRRLHKDRRFKGYNNNKSSDEFGL